MVMDVPVVHPGTALDVDTEVIIGVFGVYSHWVTELIAPHVVVDADGAAVGKQFWPTGRLTGSWVL